MFKRNKFYTVVATSALITFTAMSTAQQTETSTSTVTVSNTFTLTETAALAFGNLAVYQNLDVNGDGTDVPIDTAPIYTVLANTSSSNTLSAATYTGDEISSIVELTAGTPATYTISNAARYTNLSVSFPSATFTLTNSLADPTTNSTFTGGVAIGNTNMTSGGNTGVIDNSTNPLRTDVSGNAGFSVGASLTPNVAATTFPDGTYTGNFSVTVSY